MDPIDDLGGYTTVELDSIFHEVFKITMTTGNLTGRFSFMGVSPDDPDLVAHVDVLPDYSGKRDHRLSVSIYKAVKNEHDA